MTENNLFTFSTWHLSHQLPLSGVFTAIRGHCDTSQQPQLPWGLTLWLVEGRKHPLAASLGVLKIIDIPNTSQHNISSVRISSDHTARSFYSLWRGAIWMLELCRPTIDVNSFSEEWMKVLTLLCFISQKERVYFNAMPFFSLNQVMVCVKTSWTFSLRNSRPRERECSVGCQQED